jgi:hypothetical protein
LYSQFNYQQLSTQLRTLKLFEPASTFGETHQEGTKQLRSSDVAEGKSTGSSAPLEITPLDPYAQSDKDAIRRSQTALLPFHGATADQILSAIVALWGAQDLDDNTRDAADLRQLQRTALLSGDDVQILDLFQVRREELVEAVKTLQRALETPHQRDAETPLLPVVSHLAGTADARSTGEYDTISGEAVRASLDSEFIQVGIDAMRRMSHGQDLDVPSWTITRCAYSLPKRLIYLKCSSV